MFLDRYCTWTGGSGLGGSVDGAPLTPAPQPEPLSKFLSKILGRYLDRGFGLGGRGEKGLADDAPVPPAAQARNFRPNPVQILGLIFGQDLDRVFGLWEAEVYRDLLIMLQ
jgi:hypothetical protein